MKKHIYIAYILENDYILRPYRFYACTLFIAHVFAIRFVKKNGFVRVVSICESQFSDMTDFK